jgi:hypothetical protein
MAMTSAWWMVRSMRAVAEGAHRACILLGIIATCRTVGVPVQAYLAWAFDRLGTHRATYGLTADQLTPAAFKAAAG